MSGSCTCSLCNTHNCEREKKDNVGLQRTYLSMCERTGSTWRKGRMQPPYSTLHVLKINQCIRKRNSRSDLQSWPHLTPAGCCFHSTLPADHKVLHVYLPDSFKTAIQELWLILLSRHITDCMGSRSEHPCFIPLIPGIRPMTSCDPLLVDSYREPFSDCHWVEPEPGRCLVTVHSNHKTTDAPSDNLRLAFPTLMEKVVFQHQPVKSCLQSGCRSTDLGRN